MTESLEVAKQRKAENQKRWLQTEKGKAYLLSRANKESKYRSRKNRNAELYKFIAQLKIEKGCIKCGYNTHHVALEFHHRNPEEKLINVSQCRVYSRKVVLTEIEKCDVICSNCHRILEYEKFLMG